MKTTGDFLLQQGITAENVKLLCAKHNLSKSDRIMVLIALFVPLTDHFLTKRG